MNGKLFPPFFLLIVIFLTAGCAQHLHVNVLYDRTGGVQEGDPVYLENQEIGAVQNPEVTSTGRIVIPLRIDSGFRDQPEQAFGAGHVGDGDVREDRAKADRHEQERLESAANRQIDEQAADAHHEDLA